MTTVSLTTVTLIYSTLTLIHVLILLFNKGCPDGWTPFGTRCFKFFDSHFSWTQAEKSCQSHGANLASIHSAEENAFVVDLIKEATGENRKTWIGGHDRVQENLWMWTDGSVWDYAIWASGEPNNTGEREHFVEINYSATHWNDYHEDHVQSYICARDASPKVSLTLGNCQCKCTPDTN
uniref:C-type lectin domain-containing protein n=1 Tax=Neogobius melanostomus TaxID=47308 RepID=A0A8C6S6I8_9GOBI